MQRNRNLGYFSFFAFHHPGGPFVQLLLLLSFVEENLHPLTHNVGEAPAAQETRDKFVKSQYGTLNDLIKF